MELYKRQVAAAAFLPIAVADKAVFSIETLDDLRKLEIPPGENELILVYNEDTLDRPILRKCIQAHGISDEPMPKTAFLAIHQNTLRNASYFRGTSIHAIRRHLSKRVDGKSSPLKHARPLVSGFSFALC